jgi:hypothetical protein
MKGAPVLLVLLLGMGMAVGLSGGGSDPMQPADEGFCAADEFGAIEDGSADLVPGGCRRCKDRPWCECTYQGHPRISCDPCCYDRPTGPICLD